MLPQPSLADHHEPDHAHQDVGQPSSRRIARHRSATHGGTLCQEGVVGWPGDRVWPSGLRDCCAGFPRRCRVSCRRAAVGQAGAPAAVAPVRARARTNELDAGKRRPMIGGEERPASAVMVAGAGGCRGGSPELCGLAEWVSQPPIRPPAGAGVMTMSSGGPGCSVSSSSAAGPTQDDLRARPGWATPPGRSRRCRRGRGRWRGCGVFGVGEQVPGAGEQLAGDRGGGDLLPAPGGDGLVAGGELR
jgi:hypothetical protein